MISAPVQTAKVSLTLKQRLGRWLIPLFPFSRRTFEILRFEAGCLTQRLVNLLNPAYRVRIKALRRMQGLAVNLGSGGRGLPGWINMDARPNHLDHCIAYDIRRPLPFATGSVARILAEHVIEHLDFREDIPRVLEEFHRVLQHGGVVRIVVPDAERFLCAYAGNSREEFARLGWNLDRLPSDIFTRMHVINHVFHQDGEHQFGWDFETMSWALDRAGFEEICRCRFGESLDPGLAIDQPNHAPYSLYVEARKI